MPNIVFPGGAGVTIADAADLEADDMVLMGSSSAGVPTQTNYSEVKAGILANVVTLDPLISGTFGGLALRKLESETINITATTSVSMEIVVFSPALLFAAQVKVMTALDTGEEIEAEWVNNVGTIASIGSATGVAGNIISAYFDASLNSPISTDAPDIVIKKKGGGTFAGVGSVRAIAYYWDF